MKIFLRTFRQSLSARILALAFLNLALLMIVLAYSVGPIYRTDVRSFMFAPIEDRILSVSRYISFDLLENGNQGWDSILAKYSANTPLHFYLFDAHGRQIAGKAIKLPPSLQGWTHNVDASLSYTPHWNAYEFPDSQRGTGVFYLRHEEDPDCYWAATHILIHYTDTDMYGHATLVWAFHRLWTSPYFINVWPYIGMIAAAVIVTLLCWIPVIRGLLGSISRLTQASAEIAQGNFSVQLRSSRKDEVGQLTRSIESMAGQLSVLVDQQRRFVSDAAHELCSPTSRMQVTLAIMEQEPAPRDMAPYLDDLKEEAQQLTELVSDLLSFSRTEIGAWDATIEEVELAPLIHSALQKERVAPQVVQLSLEQDLVVFGVRSYLARALGNLIRNAQSYAGSCGPIEITTKSVGKHALVEISDHGPGLGSDSLDKIFLPFYRPEFARSRQTGGAGLGLAIVKNCVEASRGEVVCRNRSPHGLLVEIRLERADRQEGAAPTDRDEVFSSCWNENGRAG